MRTILTLCIALLASPILYAQQVQKCCGTTNSSFLLGSANYARHNQGIYLPSDFNTSLTGDITRIYFRYGTVNIDTANTLTDLTISLAQSQQTSHVNDLFITEGLTPVLTSPVYMTPPGNPDEWFPIDLDTPFPYDPTLSLIVDIRFDQSAVLLTCRAVGTPGRKLATGDPLSLVGTSSSDNLHDIGFDLDATTGIPAEGPMITLLHPNPATDRIRLSFDNLNGTWGRAEVMDAQGRVLVQERTAEGAASVTLDVSALAAGFYTVRLIGGNGVSIARPFIRE